MNHWLFLWLVPRATLHNKQLPARVMLNALTGDSQLHPGDIKLIQLDCFGAPGVFQLRHKVSFAHE